MEHLDPSEGACGSTLGLNTRRGQMQLEQSNNDELIKIAKVADEEVSVSYSSIAGDSSSDTEEDFDSNNGNCMRGDGLENTYDNEVEDDADRHEGATSFPAERSSQGIVATTGSRPSKPLFEENDSPDSESPLNENQQSFQVEELMQPMSNPTGSSAPKAEFTRQKSKSDVTSEFALGADGNPASDYDKPTAASLSLALSMKSSARHTIHSPLHFPRRNEPSSTPNAKILRHRHGSQLKLRPVHVGITRSLAMSMTQQHAQFAHACVDLLDQQDRNEAIRRKNIHRELLNCGKFKGILVNDNALQIGGRGESCQLLNLMKSGPLFKLHRRGGSATKKQKNNNGMKMTGSVNYLENVYDSVLSETSAISSVSVIGAAVVRTGITSKLLTKWKTKYVEVRKGVLSYYDDSPSPGLVRKNIPLFASSCTCVPIDDRSFDSYTSILEQFSGDKICSKLYAFELNVHGDVPRIFATGSKSTRQAWINSIYRGMINDYPGDDAFNAAVLQSMRIAESDDNSTLVRPELHSHMRKYTDLSHAAKFASSPELYIEFANHLWGSTQCIPVKLLQKSFAHMLDISDIDGEHRINPQPQPQPCDSDETFWRDISRSIVVLNGYTIRGDSIYGAERVFGALTRRILECDKSTNALLERGTMRRRRSGDNGKRILGGGESNAKDALTELQAVRYARDILRNIGRFSELTDQLFLAVESLCDNGRDFVGIECVDDDDQCSPMIKINVSSYLSEIEDHSLTHRLGVLTDRREWIHVRDSNKPNSIQRFFCILSVGVLCFYKKDLPKPCLLQGQMFLVGARLGVWEQTERDSVDDQKYILCVIGQENGSWSERQLFFEDRECFLQWKNALELAITSCTASSTQYLEHTDQFFLDEMNIDQQPKSTPSTPMKTNLSSPTPLHLLEEDNDGVTWIVHHPPGTNETGIERRASRDFTTNIFLRERMNLAKSTGNIDPYSSSVKMSKMPTKFAERAKKSLTRKSRRSIDSFCEGIDEFNIDDVNLVPSRDPSVEMEFQTSQFFKVYFKKSPEKVNGQSKPNKTIITIRATFIIRLLLASCKGSKVIKYPELIKLDSLKGSVEKGAFDFIFDTKTAPERRCTI